MIVNGRVSPRPSVWIATVDSSQRPSVGSAPQKLPMPITSAFCRTPPTSHTRGSRSRSTLRTCSLREETSRDLLVETDRGAVRGIRRRGVRMWRGIPYAASTGGARRFRAPEPAPPWDGVRDASTFGPVAPQNRKGQFIGAHPQASPQRGLPQRQRDRARRARGGSAGDGVHPRRRVQRRLGGGVPAAGRAARAATRHRVRQPELPARRARLAGLPRVRVAAASVRVQPRPARPGRRARVGAPEHPRVRRRPGERDAVRRVVRRELGDDPHDRARRGGPLRAGDRAELARATRSTGPRSPRSGRPST